MKIQTLQKAGLLTVALGLSLTGAAHAQDTYGQDSDSPRIRLNGQPFDTETAPILQDGRVLVPLRDIFEGLGARVDFNRFDHTIAARRGSTVVRMTLGSTDASINNAPVTLDVPADSIQGRTFVPLRFVSEALGANVNYDSYRRVVSIQERGGRLGGRPGDRPGSRPGGRPGRDRDRDGVPDRRDADRDGDGLRDDRDPVVR